MEYLERVIYATFVFVGILLIVVNDGSSFLGGTLLMLGLLRMQDPFCRRS